MTRRPAVLLFGGLSVVARHAGLIEEARARDLDVLLISSGGDSDERRFRARRELPGHPFGLVDGWAFLAKPRPDHVLSVVGGRFGSHHIVAALSCGEVFVEPCGVVADLLGLAGPGLRASRVCRNKQLQRAYLADWSPRSAYVAPEARSRAARLAPGFPCVLKPVGRMSSSGVRRADDPAHLGALVAAAPPGEGLLDGGRRRGGVLRRGAGPGRPRRVGERDRQADERGGRRLLHRGSGTSCRPPGSAIATGRRS